MITKYDQKDNTKTMSSLGITLLPNLLNELPIINYDQFCYVHAKFQVNQ